MKLLKLIALILVVMMLGSSALAASRVEELTDIIYWETWECEPQVTLERKAYYMSLGYTEAEWEEACAAAVNMVIGPDGWGWWNDEWESDPMTLHGQYADISYHGALIRDLGDESVPMSVLCALAAAAFGGVMFARRKRVCA